MKRLQSLDQKFLREGFEARKFVLNCGDVEELILSHLQYVIISVSFN